MILGTKGFTTRFTGLVCAFIAFAFILLATNSTVSAQGQLAGQWRGSWNSCTTGHKGKLNAQFCRIDANHVKANFRGNFAKIFPFRYRPVLNVVHEEPGMTVLAGSKKLPIVGTFEYNATITGDQFNATYRSKRDHGRWQMRR